jgi:ABC-type lipoprotein export system ATPase subunit
MTHTSLWCDSPLGQMRAEHPLLGDLLQGYGIALADEALSLRHCLDRLPDEHFEDIGIGRQQLLSNLERLLQRMQHSEAAEPFKVSCLTIEGGRNKLGEAENICLDLLPGSVTSIVGPTGSGKSRLLADIEWMAQGDTPTRRQIRINGQRPDPSLRFSLEHKLVAQLSQNMNFVMDTSAGEFIRMHAESRMIDPELLVSEIINQANRLAGEPFSANTPITALSGGQSRALMIADTAFLSASPVVLIDEVENAGIDRKRALQLLVRKEKIVLMATHDPILALSGSRRLVIRNGGIFKVLTTSAAELANLQELEAMDARIHALRQRLRQGEELSQIE